MAETIKKTETRLERIDTVCFTGHRDIEFNKALHIPSRLKSLMEELIAHGARSFRAGGALGFDMIAALCVLELKEKHPDIRLDLKLPCKSQADAWSEVDQRAYNSILAQADSIEYTSEHYVPWCMHERNRRLVNGSQVCIAYLLKSKGGTAYTYNYALKKGLKVINLANMD